MSTVLDLGTLKQLDAYAPEMMPALFAKVCRLGPAEEIRAFIQGVRANRHMLMSLAFVLEQRPEIEPSTVLDVFKWVHKERPFAVTQFLMDVLKSPVSSHLDSEWKKLTYKGVLAALDAAAAAGVDFLALREGQTSPPVHPFHDELVCQSRFKQSSLAASLMLQDLLFPDFFQQHLERWPRETVPPAVDKPESEGDGQKERMDLIALAAIKLKEAHLDVLLKHLDCTAPAVQASMTYAAQQIIEWQSHENAPYGNRLPQARLAAQFSVVNTLACLMQHGLGFTAEMHHQLCDTYLFRRLNDKGKPLEEGDDSRSRISFAQALLRHATATPDVVIDVLAKMRCTGIPLVRESRPDDELLHEAVVLKNAALYKALWLDLGLNPDVEDEIGVTARQLVSKTRGEFKAQIAALQALDVIEKTSDPNLRPLP